MILLDVIVGEEGTLLNQQSKKQKTTKDSNFFLGCKASTHGKQVEPCIKSEY